MRYHEIIQKCNEHNTKAAAAAQKSEELLAEPDDGQSDDATEVIIRLTLGQYKEILAEIDAEKSARK